MASTVYCDICGHSGDYSSMEFYNDKGVSLINLIPHPDFIEDICLECYKDILNEKDYWIDYINVLERLEIGL